MVRTLFAAAAVAAIAGCTTTPVYNSRLDHFDPQYGYRFKNVEAGENSDDLFIILTFSGGGTRASALSLGVLEKLAATEIEWNGRKCRLLDEVDLISSVSGGTFTATYYGMFRDRVFTDFPPRLYAKNNSILLKAAFALPNVIKQMSPFYSRTDTAANRYTTGEFENKTFGDLMKQPRPFILINATDMGMGRQFSFTQDYFDLLYSDLSTYPLGNAVAASSAYPGAFSALLLENHPKGDDYAVNPWFHELLASGNRETMIYRTASDFEQYADPKKIRVHLSDGGVSDNLGLLQILGSLNDPDLPFGLIPTIPAGTEQKIVIIVVNAAARPPDKLSYKGQPPGLFKLLGTAGATPMGWFTQAQLGYLRLAITYIEETKTVTPGVTPEPGTNAARIARSESPRKFYFTEVAFQGIEDDSERAFFETIPTTFTLPAESIDRLRTVAGTMLESDPTFQSLLAEIGVKE